MNTEINIDILSTEKLRHLKPSDLLRIKTDIEDNEKTISLLILFLNYLTEITNFTAAERDQLCKILLQLKFAGLWNKIHPSSLIIFLKNNFDNSLIEEISETLLGDEENATTPEKNSQKYNGDMSFLKKAAERIIPREKHPIKKPIRYQYSKSLSKKLNNPFSKNIKKFCIQTSLKKLGVINIYGENKKQQLTNRLVKRPKKTLEFSQSHRKRKTI